MFWQKPFDHFVKRISQHNLPVQLKLWNGQEINLGSRPRVCLIIRSTSALRHFLSPSITSLGQAYIEGEIDVEGAIDDIMHIAAQLAHHADKSPRNLPRLINHAHQRDAMVYQNDISTDFYRLWLDKEMLYSCAYFRTHDDSLEDAQLQKLDHILGKLHLKPGQRLLDISCGWGGLVQRAAEKYGVHAVGITVSRQQYEHALQRIAQARLEEKVEIRLQDYRDVSGSFDRIVSVGMFKHIEQANLPDYFRKIHTLLADDGICMNHGITSSDPDCTEMPFGGGEFIERYVFPHGKLPHIGLMLKEMSAAGLEVTDVENLQQHYALTTQHWSQRFEKNGVQLQRLVGEKNYRIWRTYLAGCTYGFSHNWMALHQTLAIKAKETKHNPLPLTRDYLYK